MSRIGGYRQVGVSDNACLSEMKRGNDSGSDNMVFSVFYGTSLLACREAKPGRVILGRRIIGTGERFGAYKFNRDLVR